MIRHIVLFRFAPTETDPAAAFESLAGALRPLATSVEGVISLRVDADPKRVGSHWDAALVSEHESWDDLAAYQVHPAHLDALKVVNEVIVDKAVVDYEA